MARALTTVNDHGEPSLTREEIAAGQLDNNRRIVEFQNRLQRPFPIDVNTQLTHRLLEGILDALGGTQAVLRCHKRHNELVKEFLDINERNFSDAAEQMQSAAIRQQLLGGR